MVDKPKECLEAFEKWAGIGADYVGSTRHAQWLAWQDSRSAFAAELVRRLEGEGRICGGCGIPEYVLLKDAIALIRQMAGEK